ncbi:helix-turn-helix domain-containing protein [Brooklawnia cerclae]|uniref:helix-turn-helix transcriptional regulator n=1 Tax=Brooklawnia cerclae TaxID=349934 RepID=UPI0031E0174B
MGITAARARVLARLRSRREPWTVQELGDALGLHRNTIREHLAALTAQGLADMCETRADGPGRPAQYYRATPLGCGVDYVETLGALLDALDVLPDRDAFIREVGERWGNRLAAQLADTHGEIRLVAALNELGFGPAQVANGNLVLRNCPVLAAANRNPEAVCGIHKGLMRVLARASDDVPQAEVELIPNGAPGGCLLVVTQRARAVASDA